jgi:hypothetical protein
MTQAINLAAIARRTLLSSRLTGTGTDMVITGLEADTLYDGTALFVAALDGAVGWQSRTISGGAWDAGASDYNSQVITGFSASSSIVATNNAHGQMGTIDAGSTAVAGLIRFTLYTGSASRQATVNSSSGYITTDGTSIVAGSLFSRRVASAAIVDIRFLNITSANGLAAGSRVFMQRIG